MGDIVDEAKRQEAEKEQVDTDLGALTDLINQYNEGILNAEFASLSPEQAQAANDALSQLSSQLGGIQTGVPGVLNQLAGVQAPNQAYTDQLGNIQTGASGYQAALSQLSPGTADALNRISQLNPDYSQYQAQIAAQDPGLAAARNQLANISASGLGEAQTRTSDIANQLQAIGTGQIDPRYQAVADAQLAQLNRDQGQRVAQTSEYFGRRGVGGSAAELNALNQLSNQYDLQRQNLIANVGLQGLQRSDNALTNALAASNQQAQLGLAGGQFEQGLLNQQAQLGLSGAQFGQSSALQQAQLAQAQNQEQAQLANQLANLGLSTAQFQQGNIGQQAQLELSDAQLQAALLGQQQNQAAQNAQLQAALLGQQGQLGLQQGAFEQGLLQQQTGLTQQQLANLQAQIESQNTATNQGIEATTAGLENASVPLQLLIAKIAAENAGRGGDSGGKK